MRQAVPVLIISGLFATGWILDVAGQEQSSATVIVRVPSNAKVLFDGTRTQQTGARRPFITPRLSPGRTYTYELKVEIDRDGRVLSDTRQVSVKAGQTVEIDFGNMDAGNLVVERQTVEEFNAAGELICAWRPGKGAAVIKACEDLGLKLTGGSLANSWVVCQSPKKFDAKTIDTLRQHADVRYVEPNFARSITPVPSDVNRLRDDKPPNPVVLPNEVLKELNRTGKMICAWRPGQSRAVIKAAEDLGLKVTGGDASGAPKWIVCEWGKDPLPQKTLEKLLENPGILYVEPAGERSAAPADAPKADVPSGAGNDRTPFNILPQDTFFSKLYGMKNIRATDAWKAVQVSPIVVAVIDTGVDYNHEDLLGNMWRNPNAGASDIFGADFIDTKAEVDRVKGTVRVLFGPDPMDRHYHGTHVAGTIGAVGNNDIGVAGVCWRVQIMAIRALGTNGFAKVDSVANSIRYAVDNGSKVINLSLGGRSRSQTELDAVQYAREKGVLLVCAAGNVGEKDTQLDNDVQPEFPANYESDNIISVGNIDIKEDLNPGSHFGKKTVHLGAPGTDIFSTFPSTKTEGMKLDETRFKVTFPTKFAAITGTSMAAPHVAGAVALTFGHPKFKDKSVPEIQRLILQSARPLSSLSAKCVTGGTLDISFLGEGAKPPPAPAPPPIDPPPEVVKPQPIYYYPPAYVCPQYRYRVWGRCGRPTY